ncbi:MAG: glycosyltransferase [Candidatus Gottesmanbacteria bacterium]
MSTNIERRDASAVMAFYADSELSPNDFALLASQSLHSLAYLGRNHEVTLVDDGDTLRGAVNIRDVVCTIKPERHLGKAGAVREGLKAALENNPQAQYFIQSDFDGDPNPQQAQKLLQVLVKNSIGGDSPAMVLGERDDALRKKGFLDQHRTVIFALQQKFCAELGYPQIVDPTTGLRVYTRKLAELFAEHGKSTNFGSDVEQLVLAKLVGASVFPIKLTSVRKRADQTAVFKFIDCQNALKLHAGSLRAEGLGKLVDTFGMMSPDMPITIDTKDGEINLNPNRGVMKGSIS